MRPTVPPYLRPLALMSLVLAACAAAPSAAPPLTQAQQKDLDTTLAGKKPGEAQTCVMSNNQTNMRAISDSVIVYPVNGRLVYRNDMIGRCSGAASLGGTLVIEMHGSQYCRGDLVRVVNLQTGMPWGACALGEFVPYRKAE